MKLCVLGLVVVALAGCAARPEQDATAAATTADATPPETRLDAGGVSEVTYHDDWHEPANGWWRPMVDSARSIGAALEGMSPGDGFAPDLEPAPTGMAAWNWQTIGSSHGGRALRVADVTGPVVGTGGTRVYLIASIHGNEPEGRRALDLIAPEIEAMTKLHAITLRVVEDVNPDGSARNTRGNARGVDLNRNWPAQNFEAAHVRGSEPLSEPETRAIAADLDAFRPDLVIVLHSIASGPFVNYDGPAVELAAAFADGAEHADQRWRVVPNMGYPTPGSLGSYLGGDRGMRVLTIEFRRGQNTRSAANALRQGLPRVFEAATTQR
ncbi:MAG: M14 family zinc carboxypeptidase [Planctomycetota bacterium]|nr:M14 family zinc carboxypeptidase [Planctomycetota bacterium]